MTVKLFLSGILFIYFCSCKHSQNVDEYKLPSFNLMLVDSQTIFNSGKLLKGNPFIIKYFSPDCKHCQDEASELLKNISYFRNINICFITVDPIERLRLFNSVYKIEKYNNIILCKDYNFEFTSKLKPDGIPYTLIYDKNGVLNTIYSGEVSVAKIEERLNNL